MVPAGSWVSAPKEAIILGLKELPHCKDPISQRHIFFAHAYKVRILTEPLCVVLIISGTILNKMSAFIIGYFQ